MILSLLRGGTNDPGTRDGMGSNAYARNTRRLALILFVALVLVGVFQAITPDPFRHYFVDVVVTRSLIFGVAAASIVFLSAFGGMISLGQTLMYGVCAFTVGNAVTQGGSKGLNLGWNPWVGVLLGIGVTTALGFLMGLLASRSSGLYYLMITLAYGVIGYYFFVQVTVLSGFGGVNQVGAPAYIGEPTNTTNPERLFYTCLVVAVAVYLLLRYVSRTPFGLALQGVRDDPVRMNSLGYNVAMHRTWAFTLAAFVASLGGVLYVWEQRAIAPTAINLGGILNLLVMAIIGGVMVLEGAWLGAFIFVALENYVRNVVFLNNFIPGGPLPHARRSHRTGTGAGVPCRRRGVGQGAWCPAAGADRRRGMGCGRGPAGGRPRCHRGRHRGRRGGHRRGRAAGLAGGVPPDRQGRLVEAAGNPASRRSAAGWRLRQRRLARHEGIPNRCRNSEQDRQRGEERHAPHSEARERQDGFPGLPRRPSVIRNDHGSKMNKHTCTALEISRRT